MTDPTDRDDARWFRSQVDPVVDAEPVPDAWSSIAARIDGAAEAPVPDRAPRGRWLVAAAAVVVLLVASALVITGAGDGKDTVSSNQGPTTGWYIPEGLPDGWKVLSATASAGSEACAAWGTEWTKPGKGSISLTSAACADSYQEEADAEHRGTTVLDGGLTATGPWYTADIEDGSGPRVLHWTDGGSWTVRGVGITDDEAIAVANAAIADPQRIDIPVPGFELLDRWSRPERDRSPTVTVMLRAPSGRKASYELVLPGTGVSEAGWQLLDPVEVAGQPLPVTKVVEPPPVAGSSSWTSERYRGRWPGADARIHRIVLEDEEDEQITDGELEVLVGALRPATTEEWRAFLEGVPTVDAGLREHAALADVGRSTSRSTTSAAPDPGPTTVTTTSDEGAEGGEGAVTSGAGTSTPNDEEQDGFTELDDLDIRLELDSGTIRVGPPVPGTLVITNPTDRPVALTECSEGHTRWGLVPIDQPDQELPVVRMKDCFGTAEVEVQPGETVRYREGGSDPWGWRWPFRAQRQGGAGVLGPGLMGTLDPGRYLAVLEVPGRTSTLRLSVPVTVPDDPCPATDEMVTSFIGLPEADARAEADQQGLEYRVVAGPGADGAIEQDLTCQRVNVELNADRLVINALRY